jgi:hypothetical protein
MVYDLSEFDPTLVATVERSLEPYKKVLSPERIDRFREEALVLLTHHHYSAALLQQLRVDGEPVHEHSTTRPKNGAAQGPGSVKRGGGR